MQLVLAVLLAAGLPSPAQQQHATASLYRVVHSVRATGTFIPATSAMLLTQDVVETELLSGTAFAVDHDGWLLTARHVVDLDGIRAHFCEDAKHRYFSFRADSLQVNTKIMDVVGNSWTMRYTLTQPTVVLEDMCAEGRTVQVTNEPYWPVSIVALDAMADLALLKLTQGNGPVAALSWGTMDRIMPIDPVYALGFPGEHYVMRGGLLLSPCEMTVFRSEISHGAHIYSATVDYLSRYLLEGMSGMSGGPIIAGEHVVGVLVAIQEKDDLTYAVPGDYAHAWYLWARGLSRTRPNAGCEVKF